MQTSQKYIRLAVAHNFADCSSEEFITQFNSWIDDWSDSLVEDYEGLSLDTNICGELYLTIPMDQLKTDVISEILLVLDGRDRTVFGYDNFFCTEHPKFKLMRWYALS